MSGVNQLPRERIKTCPICDKPMTVVQRKTKFEIMGETVYYRCDKCNAVFAFPKNSALPILLDENKKEVKE